MLILGAFNVLKMVPPLMVAVCIHRCRSPRLQFFYRTLFVVPMVIPPLVIALIWRSFFFEATSGYMNQALHATGLFSVLGYLDQFFGWGGIFEPGKSPAWLGDPRLIWRASIQSGVRSGGRIRYGLHKICADLMERQPNADPSHTVVENAGQWADALTE